MPTCQAQIWGAVTQPRSTCFGRPCSGGVILLCPGRKQNVPKPSQLKYTCSILSHLEQSLLHNCTWCNVRPSGYVVTATHLLNLDVQPLLPNSLQPKQSARQWNTRNPCQQNPVNEQIGRPVPFVERNPLSAYIEEAHLSHFCSSPPWHLYLINYKEAF